MTNELKDFQKRFVDQMSFWYAAEEIFPYFSHNNFISNI